MGVRVNEKILEDQGVTLKLWDIAGEIQQRKVPKIYFAQKKVILYVIDITRPFSFKNIVGDLEYLRENARESVIKVIGNKKDLLTEVELRDLQYKELPVILHTVVSAKTGENLSMLFSELLDEVLLKS